MEFSRQGYWSGLPFPFPGDLPNPSIEARSPALQAGSLQSEPSRKLEEPNVGLCRWTVNVVTCIFTRERQKSFWTEGGIVTMEAKIRVVWLQSEKLLQPPKSGRGKEEILSYSLQRECKLTDTSILDFRPPELWEKKFLVFKKKKKTPNLW